MEQWLLGDQTVLIMKVDAEGSGHAMPVLSAGAWVAEERVCACARVRKDYVGPLKVWDLGRAGLLPFYHSQLLVSSKSSLQSPSSIIFSWSIRQLQDLQDLFQEGLTLVL